MRSLTLTGFTFLFMSGAALAHPITIQPGAYAGTYTLAGSRTGPATVDLPTGNHEIRIGASGSLFITVDAAGDVSTTQTASATASSSTLTFKNTVVTVAPAAYAGAWRIRDVTNFLNGVQSTTLVPGITYQIVVGRSGQLFFTVDAAGDVSTTQTTSATASGSTLTFKTTVITVDPAAYAGSWRVRDVTNFTAGAQSVTVVPGLGYVIVVGRSGQIFVSVDAAGNISTTQAASATTSGSTLTFRTTVITVDPAAFTGLWNLRDVTNSTTGTLSVVVVPGLNYVVLVSSSGQIFFTVDAVGDVSTTQTDSATASGDTLVFENAVITVDPGSYTGAWDLRFVSSSLTGVADITIVPGLTYRLRSAGLQAFFTVAGDCTVTPNPISLAGATFHITCSLQQQRPPTADAGEDLNAGCAQTVTLDGTGSSDPDGDTLTYTWTGPFGTATGATPTVTLAFGTHTITLTVDDGNGNTDTDEVVVAVAPCPCPLSQGYWKNHPEEWPVTELVLGAETYAASELLSLLRHPVRGDASIILAKQLIAAKLNLAQGSDPAPIAAVIVEADDLCSAGRLPLDTHPGSAAGKAMTAAAAILDDYNNGRLTPNCGVTGAESPVTTSSVAPPAALEPAPVSTNPPAPASVASPASGVKGSAELSAPAAGGGSNGGGCSLTTQANPSGAPWFLALILLLALRRATPRREP